MLRYAAKNENAKDTKTGKLMPCKIVNILFVSKIHFIARIIQY
jgi:hypothetical protein